MGTNVEGTSMTSSRLLLGAALAALCLASGCKSSASQTVTVGEPGQKGVIRRDIDLAHTNADGASAKIRSGEKDVYGG